MSLPWIRTVGYVRRMSSVTKRFHAGRAAITFGAIILVLAISITLHAFKVSVPASPVSGISTLPALTLPGLNGRQQNIAGYRGRPLFVNMWATWCPPCRAEIPDLERLYEAKKSTGFAVLGVDQGQEASPVAAFVSDYRLTYPILLDTSERLSAELGSNGLPTTLVYNRAGRLVDVITGMMAPDVMQAELEKATAQ